VFFIPYSDIPINRRKDVTYGRIVCDYRPQKAEPERTRLTAGGDRIHYPGDVSTDTADLTTAKLLINSTISTKDARYACFDLKDFYLGTPLPGRHEFMRLDIRIVPQEIVDEYKLLGLVHNGYIYMRIERGMYGLPHAGLIANQQLVKFLAPDGYAPCARTPGLWKHKTRPVTFTLVVDDFGIKYVGREHANHLLRCLERHYQVSTDWEGKRYCGITLTWDYKHGHVDLSMPGYVTDALHQFQHSKPTRATDAPSPWTAPTYGVKVQMTKPADTTDAMTHQQTRHLQTVVGKFLYYQRAVDPTMQHALSTLATQQTTGTQQTMNHLVYFLNYCASHPDAKLRYSRSDMILYCESDAAYLTEPQARSRSGGYHYLGNRPGHPLMHNGPVLTISKVIKAVMSAASEAEAGSLFINGKEVTVLRTSLEEIGHVQPATPIATDNSTASGIMNRTVKQQRSKAMDMRFYWVQDRVDQQQFWVYWAPGHTNLGDYFTKHHPPAHHRFMRPVILGHQAPPPAQTPLRGCAVPTPPTASASATTVARRNAPSNDAPAEPSQVRRTANPFKPTIHSSSKTHLTTLIN
jgi:hypothetical protein